MKKRFAYKKNIANHINIKIGLLILMISISKFSFSQGYNPLWIPDTLSGTVFNLELKDTTKQFFPGFNTHTMGINGNWWGPTLIFNKGDTVHMHVMNNLMDTTTIHWHGIHLPPIMDGGPHQPIFPMTMWMPEFKVTNNAATYWYHPHLHMMSEEQLTMGLGGLIIVRDSIESTLNLPRHYGVDDIPLILTDRRFDSITNELVISHYGDTMTLNGTINPEITLPAQVVRFRILNASLERSYRFGFNNNHAMFIITSDGGLLNAPVSVTRYMLSPGERVEVLVNFTGQQGQTFDIKAYNGSMPADVSGSQAGTGVFANALGGRIFNILHVNVGAVTTNPVTTIPSTLTSNNFWSAASANVTRHVTMSDPPACPTGFDGCSWFDSTLFDIKVINKVVFLNSTEIWEVQNLSARAHPFHIHDVQFYILDYNGVPAPAYEQGWKDVVLVRANTTARFIAKFQDYADADWPFMYHCHIAFHEDYGMMGQFVVVDSSNGMPLPDISYSVQDTSLCKNDCVQFNATSVYPVDTWLWHFSGATPDSSNLQNPIVCYNQSGSFNVSLKATNSGGSDSIVAQGQMSVSVCTSIAEQDKESLLNIYPNPATNNLMLAFQGNSPFEVYIYTINGQIIFNEKIKSASYNIALANILSGLYFFKAVTSEGVIVKKFQKQ